MPRSADLDHHLVGAACAQACCGQDKIDALVEGAIRAQVPTSMLPFASAISLYDRWQPNPELGQAGFVELVVDFSGVPSLTVDLIGLHRFSFPYGSLADRQQSVLKAREGGLKLMDAYGLPIHDYLTHVDGEAEAPASAARPDLVQTMRAIDKAFGLVLDGSL